ncbi:SDR family NAD(P)-dependent oxidoreductase [Oceanidesulfovibrio marinus]|uniref:Oxidoreductase n=1 Tax=Oceanidesulfovibrio marinus TaxID=370038 RepID=A0A6P1ZH03_9BACT|nr:SDR family oxidoreductase [Oceanidesulfovibrio marinus]QJT09474.1 SDR family oxidoreductase [Oceanidesulfovibrio marinus]TVM33699.1 oxidoreductase [Oceanidesulfovibrio marinus]
MQIDLTGKTAIVTGSTAGIGLATATGLARAGARVIVNGRTQSAVDEALQQIRADVPGADADGFAGDLGTASGCDAMVQAHPACDILVNNLGIYQLQDFFETPDSEWERFFQINVMSGVRLARAYGQGMVNKGWGRIVFLASESALNIPADMIHYGFTKTGYMAIARGLAKRLAGTGVTVNSVLPGPTLSKGVRAMLEDQRSEGQTIEEAGMEFVKNARPSSIIQRPASVEEVANMIVYACSPQASATTGAALRVEGGIVDTIA